MSYRKTVLIYVIVGIIAGAVSGIIGRLIEFEHSWILTALITGAAIAVTSLILSKKEKTGDSEKEQ
jgi:low affinity Fe/Cu permease